MKKLTKKIWSWVLIGALAMGLMGGIYTAKALAANETDSGAVSDNPVYHATLGIQTADTLWMHRFGYYGKLGEGAKNLSEFDTDNYDKLITGSADKAATYAGAFVDAEITDDGEYTVSLDGADFAGEQVVSQLHVATDIPVDSNIQLSNIHLKVNDQEIMTMEQGMLESDDSYLKFGKVFLLINHWRDEITELNDKAGLPEGDNGYAILDGGEDSKVAISFTVSGYHETTEPTSTPSPTGQPTGSATPSAQPSVQPSATVTPSSQPKKDISDKTLEVGSKHSSGKLVYTVTKAAGTKESGTLMVSGLSKSGKKASALSVPASLKIGTSNYKVTQLKKNALKGAKATSVTLGKNIREIPAGAFAKCTKLKSLTLKAKLSSVKKGAFKGCKKTIKVKGGSKKKNLMKLKKSGYKKFK